MSPTVVIVAVALLIGVGVLYAVVSRRVDPTARRYLGFAAHRGWSRIPNEAARERLVAVPEYLTPGTHVQIAVGGTLGSGQGMTAVVDGREPGVRRWYIALADNDALADAPEIDFDPRAVRTVRVVDVREVQVDEPRISRGWRITSPEHVAAEQWLHEGRRPTAMSDVLHRPHPWVFCVRIRPGLLTVHLARSEEQIADLDDLRRLVTLAADLVGALDMTPVRRGSDET